MDGRSVEIWAGVEPSVVRIGDRYVDQIYETGHDRRIADLELIASLGVARVRYPVLWERVAPTGPAAADWSWSDERLQRLRALGIEPIVTLVHHGSGPKYTDLLDPEFPAKMAAYAAAVARRYPWLRYFTPVNEPLTTARFSGLYGLWYPHASDDRAFVTALFNQVAGTARAMEAIRNAIPDAQLVLTEDLGKTHSTPRLRYQANFENARRWLSADLLCGTLGENGAMIEYLTDLGVAVNRPALSDLQCVPSVLGFNYYVTGERYLDHRIDRHPSLEAGGNGKERYVDSEAVRLRAEGIEGAYALLGEAWRRYRLPMAVTEAHIGCTQDEQIRWLEEVYADLERLRSEGANVLALTVWSAFGAVDWNSLLTRRDGFYESGCFDARSEPPAPTLVAAWTRARARGCAFDHPALNIPGWWRRPDRFLHSAVTAAAAESLAVS